MTSTEWKTYSMGSGASLKKLRGLVYIHVYWDSSGQNKSHPYKVRINTTHIGRAAELEIGKEMGERKWKEYLDEEVA